VDSNIRTFSRSSSAFWSVDCGEYMPAMSGVIPLRGFPDCAVGDLIKALYRFFTNNLVKDLVNETNAADAFRSNL
jgi:hypothetical protein